LLHLTPIEQAEGWGDEQDGEQAEQPVGEDRHGDAPAAAAKRRQA
jgi:hypothetical protein